MQNITYVKLHSRVYYRETWGSAKHITLIDKC